MNQDLHTHWVLFLSCDVFDCISIKIVYFHLRYYELFLYSKSSSSLTTESQMFNRWYHIVLTEGAEIDDTGFINHSTTTNMQKLALFNS